MPGKGELSPCVSVLVIGSVENNIKQAMSARERGKEKCKGSMESTLTCSPSFQTAAFLSGWLCSEEREDRQEMPMALFQWCGVDEGGEKTARLPYSTCATASWRPTAHSRCRDRRSVMARGLGF